MALFKKSSLRKEIQDKLKHHKMIAWKTAEGKIELDSKKNPKKYLTDSAKEYFNGVYKTYMELVKLKERLKLHMRDF